MPAGKITALRAQVNDPQRVNLFIDEKFALGISLNTISKERLYVGMELAADEFERIAAAESADKAYIAALRLLEARPRSSAELRERLGRKEYTPEAIQQAVERLTGIGLVDDESFARYWVENRVNYRPRGTSALRNELRRKGVDRNVVDAVLSDGDLLGDQQAQALELARAALHKYASAPDRNTFTRKLGGYLQRRGFSFDTIRPILDTLWAELGSASDEDEIGDEAP